MIGFNNDRKGHKRWNNRVLNETVNRKLYRNRNVLKVYEATSYNFSKSIENGFHI